MSESGFSIILLLTQISKLTPIEFDVWAVEQWSTTTNNQNNRNRSNNSVKQNHNWTKKQQNQIIIEKRNTTLIFARFIRLKFNLRLKEIDLSIFTFKEFVRNRYKNYNKLAFNHLFNNKPQVLPFSQISFICQKSWWFQYTQHVYKFHYTQHVYKFYHFPEFLSFVKSLDDFTIPNIFIIFSQLYNLSLKETQHITFNFFYFFIISYSHILYVYHVITTMNPCLQSTSF